MIQFYKNQFFVGSIAAAKEGNPEIVMMQSGVMRLQVASGGLKGMVAEREAERFLLPGQALLIGDGHRSDQTAGVLRSRVEAK